MDEESVFMSNLKGSAAANLLTGIMVITFWVIKNKCKHCTCKSHTYCFECTSKEDDDDPEWGQRRRPERQERQDTFKIPPKVKIRMRKMHESEHDGVLPQHTKTLPTD